MTDRLKSAFSNIHAEDDLKQSVTSFLHAEMRKRSRRNPIKRAAVFASLALLLLAGAISYGLYTTPSAYIDVDVNPSVGLSLNRFDRVIGVYAYNEDGEDILPELPLLNKKYGDALVILMDTLDQMDYIRDDGLVAVTVRADYSEEKLLAQVQSGVSSYMNRSSRKIQLDVFSVSREIWNLARELNLSPAKYLAIQLLIGVDPTVTVESCRSHSINEIKQLIEGHSNQSGNPGKGNGHHGGGYHGGHD